MSVFALTGVGKLASDYKEAPDNKKDFVLLRDSLILGGSAVGVGVYELGANRVRNSKHVKKFMRNLRKNTMEKFKSSEFYKNNLQGKHTKIDKTVRFCYGPLKTAVQECTDNVLMVGSGILGAIGTDYGIRYTHLDKNKHIRALSKSEQSKMGTLYDVEDKIINSWENSSINKDFDETIGSEVKTNIFSQITNMPAMKMFTKTMVGMQGFEVIEEKTFKKRMQHARQCLVMNSLIPFFCMSISSSLTKGMKSAFRIPIMLGSMVAGTMYGNKVLESKHNATNKS
jgi:hypothetical protein